MNSVIKNIDENDELKLILNILELGSEKLGYLIPSKKYGYKEPLENLYQYYLASNTYDLMIKRIILLEKNSEEICKLVPQYSKEFISFLENQIKYKKELLKKGSF